MAPDLARRDLPRYSAAPMDALGETPLNVMHDETCAGVGVGSGKVILLGEHAVVYGQPALAASLERGVIATAQFASAWSLHIGRWNLTVRPRDTEDADPIERAFAGVVDTLGGVPLALDVLLQLPSAAGLGCSAAIGVAVIEAVARAQGNALQRATLSELARRWDGHFHGKASGVDSAVATYGGVGVYSLESGWEEVVPGQPLPLVIAHSGEQSATSDLVAKVGAARQGDAERVDAIFGRVGQLTRLGAQALERGNLAALGDLMNENHALLRTLDLSTPALEVLRTVALDSGAYGAKVTGAGGGGCLVVLARHETKLPSLEAALRRHSRHVFSTVIGAEQFASCEASA